KPELFTLAVGLLRFVWLSRLKNSARNWKRARSVMGMFLNSPVSHPKNPGPRKLSLPSVPNVPIAGTVNAFGFSHFTHGVGVPQVPEANGSTPGIWTARSWFSPGCDWSLPAMTVNTPPLWKVMMPVGSHPPSTARRKRFELANVGSVHTYEITSRCVWS